MSLSTDIAKFTDLVQSWASKVSDVFYSDVAQDVTIKVINDIGDIVDVTIPNHKKMQDTFATWQGNINIKNVGGTVVADDDTPLSVDKFGGLTLAEYSELYNSFFDERSVKLMPLNQGRSMPSYHFMAFVNRANKIMFWGYNNGGWANINGAANAQSMQELNQPAEQQGIEIAKIWVVGRHIAILYVDGKLYGRGLQSEGHFGIGNTAQQNTFVLMSTNVVDYNTSSHGDQDEQPSAKIIKTDGSVWSAGDNGHGELGIGNTTNTYTWTRAYNPNDYAGDKAIKVVTEGDNVAYTSILTENGNLFVTGYNGYGQLGTGDTTNLDTFTLVDPSTFNDEAISDVIMGSGYTDDKYTSATYVITASGKVWCTGYNGYGQCADGTTDQRTTFREVNYNSNHDVLTDPVRQIEIGWHAVYMVTEAGELYSVGRNNYGHLGIDNTTDQTSFQYVTDNVKLLHQTIGADATDYPSLFIVKTDDTLWSWGYNAHGELGLDHTTQMNAPAQVNFTEVGKIESFGTSGYSSANATYFKLTDGNLYACGYNGYGNCNGQTSDTSYYSHLTRVHF